MMTVKNTDWFRIEGWMLNLNFDSMEELFTYAYIYSWSCSPKGYAFVWFDCLTEWLLGASKGKIIEIINGLIHKGFVEVRSIEDEQFGNEQVLVATNPFREGKTTQI